MILTNELVFLDFSGLFLLPMNNVKILDLENRSEIKKFLRQRLWQFKL